MLSASWAFFYLHICFKIRTMAKKKGRLIIFEGIDGCGKSTQARLIYNKLRKSRIPVLLTKEPGATKLGQNIRKILLHSKEKIFGETELFLFEADRAQHFKDIVIPALKAGKIVVCDRADPSTIAYQHSGRGIGKLSFIEELNDFAKDGIRADLIILCDISPEVGIKRVLKDTKRGKLTRFEKIKFLKKVRQGFLKQARKNPKKWLVVDATRTPEEIFEISWRKISKVIHNS